MRPHTLLSRKGTIPALVLLSKGDRPIKELNEGLQIARKTVSGRLQKMADLGWVEVGADHNDADGRCRVYSLTPSGREIVDHLNEMGVSDLAENRRRAQVAYESHLDSLGDDLYPDRFALEA